MRNRQRRKLLFVLDTARREAVLSSSALARNALCGWEVLNASGQ
jgi:hypothetical protein